MLKQFSWIKKAYVGIHILQDAPYNKCRNHSFRDMYALIAKLASYGVHVVRIGKSFNNHIPLCADLTQYNLSVMESACIIKNCGVYIGGDTGMTHIASALNIPSIIAIYGPCRSELWQGEAKQMGCDIDYSLSPSVPLNKLKTVTMQNHRFDINYVTEKCLFMFSALGISGDDSVCYNRELLF